MDDKRTLRERMRIARREHVATLPNSLRALIFSKPPSVVLDRIPDGATIGLYSALPDEAPTLVYARAFHERGHALALPWFPDRDAPMVFRAWRDPYDEEALVTGPFGFDQPRPEAPEIVPDVLFVPLVGFTAQGDRLGQGAGHYDRWLDEHPETIPIGLAWDSQLIDDMPVETHDKPLAMVVTPTRTYGGDA